MLDHRKSISINDPGEVHQAPQIGRIRKQGHDHPILTPEEEARRDEHQSKLLEHVTRPLDAGGALVKGSPENPEVKEKNPCGECGYFRKVHATEGECHGMPPQCTGFNYATGARWEWARVTTNSAGCSLFHRQ